MAGNKLFIEELYKSFIKLIIFNFIFFYLKLFSFLNFRFIFISCIWLYVLRKNPTFHSYENFIFSLITSKLNPRLNSNNVKKILNYISEIIEISIPFSKLNSFFKEEKIQKEKYENSNLSKSVIIDKSDNKLYLNEINKVPERNINLNFQRQSPLLPKLIKYEIYENERWWMFVGWNKNLIFDESMIWYKKDKPKEYCDKNMIKLLDDKYIWESDWKIEISEYSDENGWEYSEDFKSEFGEYTRKKYVRRRKWVRYAIKI